MSAGEPAPEDSKKWHIIYPQYLNSELTIQRGRRLPKSKCVVNPNWKEIADVLFSESGKFEVHAYPDKCYARELDKEFWHNRGYVRYHCKDESFMNKKETLSFITEKIAQSAVRQHPDWPNNVVDPMLERAQKQHAPQMQSQGLAQGSSAPSGLGRGGGKKKKGKK